MFPIVLVLLLPYVLRQGLRAATGRDDLGEIPPAAMTAAMGPAALLTTPQGKAALARGVALTRSAKGGNPKAKRRIAATQIKAKAGDPKAKKELAVMQTASQLDEASQEDEYSEEDEA